MKSSISIVLLGIFVNGLELQAQPAKKLAALQGLVKELLEDGADDEVFSGRFSELLGLPDPTPTKSAEHGADENPDEAIKGCSLLVDKSTTGALIPRKLIFMARKESGRDSESYNFVSSLDGNLLVALVGHGKLDEKGEPVRGSAKGGHLDIESPETKKRFKRELEFWLEGKHWNRDALKKRCKDFDYEPPFCWGIRPEAKKSPAKTTQGAGKTPAATPPSRPAPAKP